MDHYEDYNILGISEGAGETEIKHAFRRIAKATHPDLNPGKPDGLKDFKQALLAYTALTRPNAGTTFQYRAAATPKPTHPPHYEPETRGPVSIFRIDYAANFPLPRARFPKPHTVYH